MSSQIDKEWMKERERGTPRYIAGVAYFIDFVVKNGGGEEKFSSPCNKCENGRLLDVKDMHFHLLRHGILQSYTIWCFHGENDSNNVDTKAATENVEQKDSSPDIPTMEDLVYDSFEIFNREVDNLPNEGLINKGGDDGSHIGGGLKFKDLHSKANEPLYPSCPKRHTTLYFLVKLNSVKTRYVLSDSSFTDILGLFKEFLPEGNTTPTKYPDMKNIIQEVGMDYDVIHACKNDCILYRKEHANKVKCPICNLPRYSLGLTSENASGKVPLKIVRHYPLIPRLKRLFAIPWIAKELTWHARAQSITNVMRHPVDSSAWKSANMMWPDFVAETRNVRLGIAADGFNPFGNLSTSYSCWPVIVVPYNLPPSLCMKKEFSMMTILISGPSAPTKDIDVYLVPLVDELKQLWFEGVTAYDSYSGNNFTMRAMLLWAIHDLPGYGTLSGCTVQGNNACPVCAEEVGSEWLDNSMKVCYRGHRRFLPHDHKFREEKCNFNNEVEHRKAPRWLSGSEIEEKVASIKMKIGKSKLATTKNVKEMILRSRILLLHGIEGPSSLIFHIGRSLMFDII